MTGVVRKRTIQALRTWSILGTRFADVARFRVLAAGTARTYVVVAAGTWQTEPLLALVPVASDGRTYVFATPGG